MALSSIVRRGSATIFSFGVRSVASRRTFPGSTSDELGRQFLPLFRFSTAASEKPTADPDANLVRLLESEISEVIPDEFPYEMEEFYNDDCQWRPTFLKRKYRDEIIEVWADWPGIIDGGDHYYSEDDNQNAQESHDDEPSLTMYVKISKMDGQALHLHLAATRNQISVRSWLVENHEKPCRLYRAPNFARLNDNLKTYLYKYLESRGIGPGCRLTNFLLDHMAAKDYSMHRYWPWLKSFKKFIESS